MKDERKRQLQTLRSVEKSVTEIEAFANHESGGKRAQKVRALTNSSKRSWASSRRFKRLPGAIPSAAAKSRGSETYAPSSLTTSRSSCWAATSLNNSLPGSRSSFFEGTTGAMCSTPTPTCPSRTVTMPEGFFRPTGLRSPRASERSKQKIYKCVRPYDPRTATTQDRIRSCKKVPLGRASTTSGKDV